MLISYNFMEPIVSDIIKQKDDLLTRSVLPFFLRSVVSGLNISIV